MKPLKVLLSAAIAAATLAATAAQASAAAHGWWATEGYTVANSGFNPNETTLTVPTVPNLTLQRTTSPDRSHQSAPVLDDGRIYVYDAAGITAYDEVTGAQVWRYEQTNPDARDGRLVVTEDRIVSAFNYTCSGPACTVIEILDRETGATLHSIDHFGSFSQLLVDRGVVVISGETRWNYDTTAYRLSDGQLLWQQEMHMHQPVSANGRLLVRKATSVYYSAILDIMTGNILWTQTGPYYGVLAASADGTKFYAGGGQHLYVVNASTGAATLLASNVHPKYASLSPTRLYVASTGTKVFGLDVNTGAIFWANTYTAALGRPIVAGGVLYVTVPGDRMYALNPVNGALLNTPQFTGTALPPVVTNGRLYTTDGVKMSVYGL